MPANHFAPTIHHPRPAILPKDAQHAWQRRFGATDVDHQLLSSVYPEVRTAIEVFRAAHADFAEVNVEIGTPPHIKLCASLAPADLRDLAARLIDAAHDIEAFPAATRAAAAPKGGAA